VSEFDLFHVSDDHEQLRKTVRAFVRKDVEPQALEHDRRERFNLSLFKKAGELGLLGITAEPEYDGAGLDAAAAVLVHEELSWSDPGFTLAYLAHSMLCVNNIQG
jgi:isovaleryl-CoA dehydrogenase